MISRAQCMAFTELKHNGALNKCHASGGVTHLENASYVKYTILRTVKEARAVDFAEACKKASV